MVDNIVNWIKLYSKNANIKTLVIGISGGVDSALVSTLSAMTGLETIVISMPIHQKEDQLKRAKDHASWLCDKYKNVTFLEKDLTELFNFFKNNFDETEKNDLSLANSRSRLRMITLYQIAGVKNGLVVGTGNKIEDFGVGFFTKYGDGGVDISPIADLTKSEVKKMATDLGIIEDIIKARPTDGLWDEDKCDEDQLGASYEELEWAMEYLETNQNFNISKRQEEVLKIYQSFNKKNKHKMIEIPVYKKKKEIYA
jgi:NAD+ synthase